jgi:sulfur carrier protein
MRTQGKVSYLFNASRTISYRCAIMAIPIIYNGSPSETVEKSTLKDYLAAAGIFDQPGIAVALNETVVPRNEWANIEIKANDNIIVIKATQGG